MDKGNCPQSSMGKSPHDANYLLCDNGQMPNPLEILADRVTQRMSELGTNARAVSLAASGKQDMVRDIMRGRMPNAARLASLANVLHTTPQWLLGDDAADRELPASNVGQLVPMTTASAPARPFTPRDLPKDVPVYTGALGTALDFSGDQPPVESQVMDLNEAVDMVRRPPGLADTKGSYALYIVGDSQSPRFESGELIFVSAHRPVSPGDDVVVQLVDDADCVSCALVKRLVRRTADFVTLRQFNPPTEFDVPRKRIRAIHRVYNNADLWGF